MWLARPKGYVIDERSGWNEKYSVQLKNLEKGGQLVNTANKLIWSPANIAQNVWVKQQETNPPTPPYFTKEAATCKGISWGGAAVTYTFDLQVDVQTPPDLYNLTFAVAGQNNDWYQEIDFYIEVLCPYTLVGDVNGDCKVDLADLALMAEHWLVDCAASPAQPACVPNRFCCKVRTLSEEHPWRNTGETWGQRGFFNSPVVPMLFQFPVFRNSANPPLVISGFPGIMNPSRAFAWRYSVFIRQGRRLRKHTINRRRT